jgi:hypothetical protein
MKDFRLMESRIAAAIEVKDVQALRAELHKMHPIVANLQFTKMTDVMKKFAESVNEDSRVEQLNQDFKECLEQIYHLLQEV